MYIVHCIVYSVHSYNHKCYIHHIIYVHCTLYSVHCTLYSVQCILYTVRTTYTHSQCTLAINSSVYARRPQSGVMYKNKDDITRLIASLDWYSKSNKHRALLGKNTLLPHRYKLYRYPSSTSTTHPNTADPGKVSCSACYCYCNNIFKPYIFKLTSCSLEI